MTRRLGPVLALALAGCVAVEGFDPVGDDAAIEGSWSIDGLEADADACGRLDADRVRVTFLDGRRPVTHSGLFFQCRTQSFDTTDEGGSGAVVGAGEWTIRIDAIDGNGNVIAASQTVSVIVPADTYDAEMGTPKVDLDGADDVALDFLSGTVSTTYTIGGESPDEEVCADAGITHIGFVIAPDDAALVSGLQLEPCRLGVLGARLMPDTDFEVSVAAYDWSDPTMDPVLLAQTDAVPVNTSPGADFPLDEGGPIDVSP